MDDLSLCKNLLEEEPFLETGGEKVEETKACACGKEFHHRGRCKGKADLKEAAKRRMPERRTRPVEHDLEGQMAEIMKGIKLRYMKKIDFLQLEMQAVLKELEQVRARLAEGK